MAPEKTRGSGDEIDAHAAFVVAVLALAKGYGQAEKTAALAITRRFGYYAPPTLEVWMRTRALEKVVKPKTFLRTLVQELLHHLDVTIFALPDSFHTEGFFRRESSVVRALFDEAKRRRPRPASTQMSLFETLALSRPAGRPSGR